MIYQESLMRVAQKFAGYSLEAADDLRKACAKKVRSLMAKERERFEESVERNGYTREIGKKLFDVIEPFADYAFPKSHAYCYGYIAYQTAWLKAQYPVEYFAALLTSVKDDKDKTAVYLAECRTMGVEVLVPDVNVSESDFIARGNTIPFGLSAIRNVGTGLVAHIVAERDANGPFTDFYDFCERVDPMVLNKRSIESLIKGGAFDAMGHPRKGLCQVFEQIVDRVLERRRRESEGQYDLFGVGARPGVRRRPHPDPRRRVREGARASPSRRRCSASTSPTTRCSAPSAPCKQHAEATIAEAREKREGEVAVVAGVVTGLEPPLHEAGRADGHVHPRGSPVDHRRVGVPEDHARVRAAARRRRHRLRQGPARSAGRPAQVGRPRGQAARRRSRRRDPADPLEPAAVAPHRIDRVHPEEGARRASRAVPRSCSTWGRKSCVCRRSSTSTRATGSAGRSAGPRSVPNALSWPCATACQAASAGLSGRLAETARPGS